MEGKRTFEWTQTTGLIRLKSQVLLNSDSIKYPTDRHVALNMKKLDWVEGMCLVVGSPGLDRPDVSRFQACNCSTRPAVSWPTRGRTFEWGRAT